MPWAWPLFLALSLGAAAAGASACSGSGEPAGSGDPHASPAASGTSGLARAPVGPASIPGHGGHMRSRCAACHSPEDRNTPRWKEVVGQMGHDIEGQLQERTTCNCCHLGEVKGFGEPFEARCLDCHDDIQVTIPRMGSQHCVSCHTLGKGDGQDLVQRAWECQKCHADKQGDSLAIDVHGGEDCANCHRPHDEPWTESRECTECHGGQSEVRHSKIGPRDTPLCTDCHSPHEKAGEADGKCKGCHKETHPDLVAKARFPGHDACTTCHTPHAFDKEGAKECASCHKQRTMTGRGEKEHAACESCHTPHDVKGASASSCGNCHKAVTSSHPDPKGQGCTSCHDPHPGPTAEGTAVVLASAGCASCHSDARTQAGDHGALTCNKCHDTHKEGQKPAACKDCHSAQATKVAQEPKHADCAGCHAGGAHRPRSNIGACSTCHADEHKTAPKGHSDCTKCHDSHSGKRLQPAGAAGCKTCHAPQAVTAASVGHNDCASCHRSHGPSGPASPPSCNTCHKENKLPALHAKQGHGTCSSCHPSAHGKAKSDRATCVDACHANEKDHQPDAMVCSGCHRFTDD
jgi:hypothetical protein